jgi:hypothetical protein
VPLSHLAGELADQRRLLDLLDAGGDPRTAVRAVFSWSYQHLDADVARAFRLAGLHPGADFDLYAVAALAGSDLGRARAHNGLGSACYALGDTGEAARHWREALAIYADLGVPEAARVRARLDELSSS